MTKLRERSTARIDALVPPTMKGDFEVWAATRGLSKSEAVKMLISDALARDARTAANALYRPLPDFDRAPTPTPAATAETPGEPVLCSCCGMNHQRELEPGEHCAWCVWATDSPHYTRTIYKPLPASADPPESVA